MDFFKLHKTSKGYQYVLFIVDSFTKWIEAFPMKTQESTELLTVSFKMFSHALAAQNILFLTEKNLYELSCFLPL